MELKENKYLLERIDYYEQPNTLNLSLYPEFKKKSDYKGLLYAVLFCISARRHI